ncbi:MAG TPA: c-type cytochrome [Gemmataceae bacterium]|nr:c-type cytochrome [Gemmataceae bacterium]
MPTAIPGPLSLAALERLFSCHVRWVLAVAVPLFGVLWMSGCSNTIEYARYPEGLVYPVRTDPIVPTDAPPLPAESFYPPGPGRLDEEIAQFAKAGGVTLDPGKISAEDRKELQKALDALFGSPRVPQVGALAESDELVTQLTALKIRDEGDAPFKTLAQGSKVYRYHCVHCHGLTGDGRGPTGPWVVPHPRDYRSGLFKFISTKYEGAPKPRRDDLLRVLRNGIENTSMPSFALLDVPDPENKDSNRPTDLEAVVSYVMHLSIRGTVEIRILQALDSGTSLKDVNVHDIMTQVVGEWANSSFVIQSAGGKTTVADNVLAPAEGSYFDFKVSDYKNAKARDAAREQSIRHGFELFSDPSGAASCISCHKDYGRQVNFRYDKWGTMVRPMNLTTGVYRGGRRPIDLFWRIKEGIAPSGMAAASTLTNEKDVWDVVNFVHCLPYPAMLPDDVRNKVYLPPDEAGKAETAEK